MHKLLSAGRFIRDLILPTQCGVCGKETETDCICENCLEALEASVSPVYTYEISAHYGRVKCASYFSYGYDPAKRLIFGMKKQTAPSAYSYSARIMSGLVLRFEIDGNMIFTGVPRSKNGMRRYGFDQALELAKRTAEIVPNARFADLLRRSGRSEEQKKLGAEERTQNIAGKFRTAKILFGEPRDESIVIFDDMSTTGSSIRECADTLAYKYPYSKLYAVTLAHNPDFQI